MKFKCNKNRGFTLIEALIASALTATIIIMLYQVFNTTSNSMIVLNRKAEVYQNGRIILDQISRTAKAAVRYNAPAGASCFIIRKAGAPSGWCTNSAGDELFFVASWKETADQVSDLVEFGYFLDNNNTLADDSDNVLSMCSVKDRTSAGWVAQWNFGTVANTWPSGNAPYNDLGYGVRSYDTATASALNGFVVEWFGATAANGAENWQAGAFNPAANAALQEQLPRAIRITLRITDPEAAKKYSGAVLNQLTVTLTTTVSLPNSKKL